MNTKSLASTLALLASVVVLPAQVPQIINYQGMVSVRSLPHQGPGLFKFSLVSSNGTATFWSNDGTGVGGREPASAVALSVDKGKFAVSLGDTSLPNMQPIPPTVFTNSGVQLRIWFDDGRSGSQQLVPDQPIVSVAYAMVAAGVPDGSITGAKLAAGAVGAGQLAAGSVGMNQLAAGAVGAAQLAPGAAMANLLASSQSAVPSGGILLSLEVNSASLIAAGFNNIGTIPFLPDKWELRSTSPGPRQHHTAVWTGSEMFVWGGGESGTFLNTGGRYHFATDTWQPIPTSGAPSGRWLHGAVWTGTEMLIWGGRDNFFPSAGNKGDGGRYNPTSNSWRSISAERAPSPRSQSATIWTGSEMIIWGGVADGTITLNTGARYNPATDTWTTITTNGAPSHRQLPAAVWTGTEMLIWGGGDWNGNEFGRSFSDGARYNPATDQWRALPTNGAPRARTSPTSVWTGKEFLILGGLDWGARTSQGLAPTVGGGGRFDPATDTWRGISTTNASTSRNEHMWAWTEKELFVWGGVTSTDAGLFVLNSGSRYNPNTDTWVALSSQDAPSPRANATSIWTGGTLLLFGGYSGSGSSGFNSNYAWTPGQTIYLYQRQ